MLLNDLCSDPYYRNIDDDTRITLNEPHFELSHLHHAIMLNTVFCDGEYYKALHFSVC